MLRLPFSMLLCAAFVDLIAYSPYTAARGRGAGNLAGRLIDPARDLRRTHQVEDFILGIFPKAIWNEKDGLQFVSSVQ